MALSAQLAQAQSIPAGTVSLGGYIGYYRDSSHRSSSNNNISTTEVNASSFDLAPSVGYFVADNLALGLTLIYRSYSGPYFAYTTSQGTVRPQPDPTTTLRIGAYAQFYKMLSEQFGFLGTLGGGYQTIHDFEYLNNSNPSSSEIKSTGYYAEITPGIVFFLFPSSG